MKSIELHKRIHKRTSFYWGDCFSVLLSAVHPLNERYTHIVYKEKGLTWVKSNLPALGSGFLALIHPFIPFLFSFPEWYRTKENVQLFRFLAPSLEHECDVLLWMQNNIEWTCTTFHPPVSHKPWAWSKSQECIGKAREWTCSAVRVRAIRVERQ